LGRGNLVWDTRKGIVAGFPESTVQHYVFLKKNLTFGVCGKPWVTWRKHRVDPFTSGLGVVARIRLPAAKVVARIRLPAANIY